MSETTDAMEFVMELIEETIGRIFLREIEETIEEEKMWWIGNDCDFCFGDCICGEKGDKMQSVDADVNVANVEEDDDVKERFSDFEKFDEVNVNRKEMKFPEYGRMNFNWQEVNALFKGQSR